jgi:hypothetical protein
MANKTGVRYNKGGSMARNKMIYIDFSNFEEYAEKLEQLEADLKDVFSKAMEEAAEKVQNDTIAALANSNLPAGGKFSQGDTRESVLQDVKTEWQGSVGEIKLGFDKTKSGAGGFLITGTPKMRPDLALERIYGSKRYVNQLKKTIEKALQREIDRLGL